MIGSRVSHYPIAGRLGAGGMGVVYGAVDEVLGRSVALEFPLPRPRLKRRPADEARAASRLNHLNVAQIYGFNGCRMRPIEHMRQLRPAHAVVGLVAVGL